MVLDKYDYLLIRHIKSNRRRFSILKRIWAKRCAISVDQVHDVEVMDYLILLVTEINPPKSLYQWTIDISPVRANYFHPWFASTIYEHRVINVCCSYLRLYTPNSDYPIPTKLVKIFTKNSNDGKRLMVPILSKGKK